MDRLHAFIISMPFSRGWSCSCCVFPPEKSWQPLDGQALQHFPLAPESFDWNLRPGPESQHGRLLPEENLSGRGLPRNASDALVHAQHGSGLHGRSQGCSFDPGGGGRQEVVQAAQTLEGSISAVSTPIFAGK